MLPSDKILSRMFKFSEDSGEALNSQFSLIGFENLDAVRNMGSTFLFLLCNLSMYLIFFLSMIPK